MSPALWSTGTVAMLSLHGFAESDRATLPEDASGPVRPAQAAEQVYLDAGVTWSSPEVCALDNADLTAL